MGEFEGKVAIVTGGAMGIARATIERLCREGATCVIVDKNEEAAKKYEEELKAKGYKAKAVAADVSDVNDIKKMVDTAIKECGRIDILVNCAGVNVRKEVLDYTEQDWDFMIDINLKGTFFTCLEVGKHMKERGQGSIVNISSIQGEEVLPERDIYAASKGGVKQLTKAFAVELAPYGVRVNCISPAFVETPMVERVLADDKWRNIILSRTPLKRLGKVEEIAEAIAFLASEKASYITGSNMMVDGGWTAG